MSETPETLTSREEILLMDYLLFGYGAARTRKKAIRNSCMGAIMLDAGLRVGEITRLRKSDLFLLGKPKTAIVINQAIAEKGCTRTIPTTLRIQNFIARMEIEVWKEFDQINDHYAFFSCVPTRPLTVRQIQRVIETASELSLHRRIHPHILRHTFASNLMRVTSIRIVQQLLGHKQLSSTQIYTHPNSNDLTQAISGMENGTDKKEEKTLQNADITLANRPE